MGGPVQQPPPPRVHREHPARRSRSQLLRSSGNRAHGRVTSENQPPANTGRFTVSPRAPFGNSISRACFPTRRERGDARLAFRDRVGPDVLVVKRAELVFLDPAADQMPTDVEPFAQSRQRLAVAISFDDHAPQSDAAPAAPSWHGAIAEGPGWGNPADHLVRQKKRSPPGDIILIAGSTVLPALGEGGQGRERGPCLAAVRRGGSGRRDGGSTS